MGYYSMWSIWPLEVNGPDERWYFEQAVEYLQENSRDANFALDVDGSSTGKEEKWCGWKADMKAMSEKFPDMVFVLKAIGEDCDEGGNWIEYWSNGKVQHEPAVITYGDFDERKLR